MNTLFFFEAVREGNIVVASTFISQGIDINSPDEDGWTVLHYSAEQSDFAMANLLLSFGADPNIENPSGYTPFQVMMICEAYNRELAKLFIDSGADVGSSLHKAIVLQDEEHVKVLISDKELISSKDKIGNSPLHTAIAIGNIAFTKLLIANKADVNALDDHDTTPMVEAAAAGHVEILRLLLRSKASTEIKDYNGRTPLIFSVGNNHKDCAELLLKHKANINIQDNFGNTPLHYAYENELFAMADYL